MAQLVNLALRRGNTLKISGSVVDEAGDPLNLTGSTITWRILPYKDAPISTAVLSKIATLTNPAGGLYEVNLGPTDTAALGREYYYEAEIVTNVGDIYDCAYGTLTLEGSA